MKKTYRLTHKTSGQHRLIQNSLCGLSLLLSLNACTPPTPRNLSIPSAEYAGRLKRDYAAANPEYRANLARDPARNSTSYGSIAKSAPAAAFHFTSDGSLPTFPAQTDSTQEKSLLPEEQKVVTNLGFSDGPQENGEFSVQESAQPNIRDYTGPLNLGEPGVSSSLWRETGALNLIRDVRAFQPMDLITIVVQENAEGKKEADTDIKQSSTLTASLKSLLGVDDTIIQTNPQVLSGDNKDLTDILDSEFSSNFKGEGETNRKGSLTGKISAMVVEVLPSGVLRIEGEKILSVNNEDEVMVISGLVRPEDVRSNNEVNSSKLANMRIDYFGQGTVGDAQIGGWISRFFRRLWPF